MAKILSFAGMLVGGIGIFFGFYFLPAKPETAFRIVTVSCVGAAGVIAFIRHVIFYQSDMKRLGWETERPDWMFEVGFANLAFGLMGLAALARLAPNTLAILLLGYACYLLQAAMLHAYRYFTDSKKNPSRLWRSVVATLLYVGMLTYFAIAALLA